MGMGAFASASERKRQLPLNRGDAKSAAVDELKPCYVTSSPTRSYPKSTASGSSYPRREAWIDLEASISDTHLIARFATAVSSKVSNSRSFDQRRRP